MEDRHAYLILAHADFKVLDALIFALDDNRNDIYIHIDKKVKNIPHFKSSKSNITILEERVDVRWGHVSMLHAELNLMNTALNSNASYSYYHIISGNHLPLKNQDIIHEYFTRQSASIFMKMPTSEYEINLKMRRFNFFLKDFLSSNQTKKSIVQFAWRGMLKLQKWLKIYRYNRQKFIKTSQWCSLTHKAVQCMIFHRKKIINKYRWTFCPDEFFAATFLMEHSYAGNIQYENKLMKSDFEKFSPRVFQLKDLELLKKSTCLFARKFSDEHLDIVDKIVADNVVK